MGAPIPAYTPSLLTPVLVSSSSIISAAMRALAKTSPPIVIPPANPINDIPITSRATNPRIGPILNRIMEAANVTLVPYWMQIFLQMGKKTNMVII